MNRSHLTCRVILFDWDGTLLDSFAADAAAYASMFSSLGISWSEQDFARRYSPNWHRIYRAVGLPRAKWGIADRLWMRAYARQNPPLRRGAKLTIRSLHRSFRLGIVSSGSRWRVQKQLKAFGVWDYFGVCVCGDDLRERKPNPAPLRAALRRLDASPGEAIYVGDTAEDVEMARRARVRAIGVLGPYPTAERLRAASPEAILSSVRELPRYLAAFGRNARRAVQGCGLSGGPGGVEGGGAFGLKSVEWMTKRR
ncbi:MAG TPA: HAD family hydrolase [Candidatus Cybelea sp.]|nr:HAD family hydrolase [Candidatus Cybelea sp.]